jgi:hypothetical protein
MPSVRRNGTMLFYEDAKGSSLARFGRLVDDCFGAGSRRSPAPAKDRVMTQSGLQSSSSQVQRGSSKYPGENRSVSCKVVNMRAQEASYGY